MAACVAGAWRTSALTTLPMRTSSTSLPVMPVRAQAPLIAMAPSSGAFSEASAPLKAPIGRPRVARDDRRALAELEEAALRHRLGC